MPTKRERTAVALGERAAKRAAVARGVRRLNPATGAEWRRDDTKMGRYGKLVYFACYRNVINADGTAKELWNAVPWAETLRRMNARKNGTTRTLGGIASTLLASAKQRATAKGATETDLASYMTHAQLLAILQRGKTQCFSTSEVPDPRERDFVFEANGTASGAMSPWAPSLDRKDSTDPHYTVDKARVVPWGFNNARGPWTMAASEHVIRALVASIKLRLSGGTDAASAALLAANRAASEALIAKRRAASPFKSGNIMTGADRNPSGLATTLLDNAKKRTTQRNAAIAKDNIKRAANGEAPLPLQEFTLTRAWLLPILEAEMCHDTFLPFEFPAHGSEDMHNYAPSLDRIDASKGYTPDNVRVVLRQVNTARGAWTDAQILPVLELLLASIVHHTARAVPA